MDANSENFTRLFVKHMKSELESTDKRAQDYADRLSTIKNQTSSYAAYIRRMMQHKLELARLYRRELAAGQLAITGNLSDCLEEVRTALMDLHLKICHPGLGLGPDELDKADSEIVRLWSKCDAALKGGYEEEPEREIEE